MGISNNSHGKKSDKETQSPLLKIFKEIMMRENNDPEKRNLLDQKEDRKRKQYTGSKTKADRRSIESSSSVHRKRSPYKVMPTEQRNFNVVRNPSGVFHSDKKESWWNWHKPRQNESGDDTCSCGSCALKRIVSSEYACIACLVLVFCITIVVAFLLVFKNIPFVATECPPKITTCKPKLGKLTTTLTDSERLKRKIEMINENRMMNELGEVGVFGKPHYDDIRSDPMDLPGSSELDFGPNLRELNGLEDGESKNLGDIEFSLNPEKMEMHNSDKLKEFYTKLVQTDAKIKNLKKIIAESNLYNNVYDGKTPDRTKRSLKLYNYPNQYQVIRRKRQAYNPDHIFKRLPKRRRGKIKRFSNATDESTGFIIEKKKLVVQYKPTRLGKKLVAKCSHSPKDAPSHQHEHQLKHPFYQNTQRLDELLDKFLNKNLPEIISDPFGLDFLFKSNKQKCKHPQPTKNIDIISNTEKDEVTKKKEDETSTVTERTTKTNIDMSDSIYNDRKLISSSNNGRTQIPKPKMKGKKLKDKHRKFSTTIIKPATDMMKLLRPESTTIFENNFNEHKAQMINKEKLKIFTSSPSDFEVLLSVSTIMNPKIKKAAKVTDSLFLDQPPSLRRLMQMEGEEEENLGYEDFKEVLTDEMENQDEVDRRGDRKRRNEEKESEDYPAVETTSKSTKVIQELPEKVVKYNPPGVQNPNWKGPMPLYPDEINSMIKQAAMNANKPLGSIPEDKEVLSAPSGRERRDLSDVEYVEDYLDNKYDKLVEMAQAYSDYGVLEGKKDTIRNEKNPATDNISVETRVKMSADDASERRDFPERQRKEQYGTITQPSSNNRMTQPSEGIRLELLPTTDSKLDDAHIYKFLNSHFSIENDYNKINNNIEKPTSVSSVQISLYPNFQPTYNQDNDPRAMYANTKTTKSEGVIDLTNIFSVSKGRTLLSTSFKKVDYGNEEDETEKEPLDYDNDAVQYSKIKRDTKSKNEQNTKTNAENKDTHTQLSNDDKTQKSQNVDMKNKLLFSSDYTPTSTELKDYYISQVTKNNIYIYSFPYLNADADRNEATATSAQYKAASSIPDVKVPDPNMSTIPEENPFIILNPSEGPSTIFAREEGPNVIGEQNWNLTDEPDQIEYDSEEFEQTLNMSNEQDLNRNKPAEVESFMSELQENIDTEDKFKSNETLIKIERCEMSPKNIAETKYEGQIELILENPEIGLENVALNFDDSLLKNYIDDNKLLSGLEEGISVSFGDNVTATPTLPASLMANVSGRKEVRQRGSQEVGVTGKIKRSVELLNVSELHKENSNTSELRNNLLANITKIVSNNSAFDNVTYKANHTASDNMTLSEFFMMISNWFKTLEDIKVNTDKATLHPDADIADLLAHLNVANETKSDIKRSSTTDSAYPMYDSDMIENIGHRSRVLLSVKENNATETKRTSEIGDIKVTGVTKANVSGNEANATIAVSPTATLTTSNLTTPEKDKHSSTNTPKKDGDTRKVKRNADDSNLIFWNDIYDDEYGVQTDNLNGVIQDKIYTKDNDFIKRSGRWVQDKIRKFTDNLKGRDQVVALKQRMPRAVKRIAEYPKYLSKKLYSKLKKRSANNQEDDDSDQTPVFNMLGANMLNVCKKAAIAVKQTSNSEVKEDVKQSSVATSLMQQLVRLLTDLVDYQVQARTCTELPSDLKTFLEWLTYPDEESSSSEESHETQSSTTSFKSTLPYPEEDVIDELIKAEHNAEFGTSMPPIDGMTENVDYKTQYLETLRDVQDLLDQYEEMSDEDKSKMTGVKFYLQNQLRYLNKQFSGYDMYNIFDKQGIPLLYKRDMLQKGARKPNQRRKRKLYKFVKTFGKKHTRTTASFYDGIPITDMNKLKEIFDARIESRGHQDRLKPTDTKNIKRNLKDVYYKAVAEAKKYATAKNGHKKQDKVEFSTTQNTRGQI